MPQTQSPFLKLPLEIRIRIYNVAISSYDLTLFPQKQGKKFINATAVVVSLFGIAAPNSPINIYTNMSLICRQCYMEVVGGALLHRIGAFTFNSPMLMENYLTKINPFHAASISTVHLRLRLTKHSPSIPKKVFSNLSTLSGLQHLSVEVVLDHDICYRLVNHTMTRWADLMLNEDICVKLETLKHWQLLKGLKTFEMAFKGYHPRYALGEEVETGSARFIAIREEIKKIVMRVV